MALNFLAHLFLLYLVLFLKINVDWILENCSPRLSSIVKNNNAPMKGGSHCGAKLCSIWGGFCFCIVSNYCRTAVLGSSRQGLVGLLKNIVSASELSHPLKFTTGTTKKPLHQSLSDRSAQISSQSEYLRASKMGLSGGPPWLVWRLWGSKHNPKGLGSLKVKL